MKAPLDSRQLKAFQSLARTGSMTETARELFLTHSAISHSMKALENDIGCRLLTRVGKKCELTEAGEALLSHATRILDEMEQARGSIQELNRWGARRLRLGAEPGLCTRFLPGVLIELTEAMPRAAICLSRVSSAQAAEVLERNLVDLVLGQEPLRASGIEFTPLFVDRYHVCVRPVHPWAAQGRVAKDDLPKERCVMASRANPARVLTENYFAEEGLALNPAIEVDDLHDALPLTASGLGISVLPAWLSHADAGAGSLVRLSTGRAALRQRWGVLSWARRPWTPAQAALLKLCQKHAAAFVTTAEPTIAG